MTKTTTSCVGCKYLFGDGNGYSNYTWMDTETTCMKGKNPNLPASEPCDWNKENDNWEATQNSRCELYSPGPYITLDPDREDNPKDSGADDEVYQILKAEYGAP